MPKPTLTDQQQVTDHIQKLDVSIQDTVQTIRQIILDTDAEIDQQIKWNNPSFYYTGDMAPFDPKEYKRDIIVLNLHKNRIMLVLPTGARVNDTTGLLEGKYTDGRRLITFKDLEDVLAKKDALQGVIRQWLALVEK